MTVTETTATPSTDSHVDVADVEEVGEVEALVAELAAVTDRLLAAITGTDGADGPGLPVAGGLLTVTDRLTAGVVAVLAGVSHRGVQVEHGLTTGGWLRVMAARTAGDETMLCNTAERLADMPVVRGWFLAGVVSWPVVRAIVLATRNLTCAQRGWVDATLAADHARVARFDADSLVAAVDVLADRARSDLAAARRQRAFDQRQVTVQPRLDGAGGQIYADLDAEGLDAVVTALDSYHPHTTTDPTDHHDSDHDSDGGDGEWMVGPRHAARRGRGRRRHDALVALARHRTADTCPANPTHATTDDDTTSASAAAAADGRVGWTPPRGVPSMLIVTPIASLTDPDSLGAQLFARTGGPVELVGSQVQRLWCDATYRQVFVDGARVLGVTAAHPKVSASLAAAVTVRDGSCRFPACHEPTAVCDIHHLIHVADGGDTVLDNLAAICPAHHRAIHDGGWTTRLQAHDTIIFARRGTTLTSLPRVDRRLEPAGKPPVGRPRRRHHTTRATSPPAQPADTGEIAKRFGVTAAPTARGSPQPEPDLPF